VFNLETRPLLLTIAGDHADCLIFYVIRLRNIRTGSKEGSAPALVGSEDGFPARKQSGGVAIVGHDPGNRRDDAPADHAGCGKIEQRPRPPFRPKLSLMPRNNARCPQQPPFLCYMLMNRTSSYSSAPACRLQPGRLFLRSRNRGDAYRTRKTTDGYTEQHSLPGPCFARRQIKTIHHP
jgi:hypothetical protein